MIYLEKAEILWINKTFILEKGGSYYEGDHNVLNKNSFEYLIEAPKMSYFGNEQYQTIFEKAAVYPYLIINDHIFHDGCKRTGMMAAFLFLAKNGRKIREEVSSPMIVLYAERITEKHLNIRRIANWFRIFSEPGYV